MKKIKLLTALALASAAFAVSAQNIATVNGKPIPKSLQDEWLAQLVANGGKDTPEARRQITEKCFCSAEGRQPGNFSARIRSISIQKKAYRR